MLAVISELGSCGQEAFRRIGQIGFISQLAADDGMGTDQHTLATLDADIGVPNGHFQPDIALFPLGGAGGIGAVDGQHADGQQIAAASDDFCSNFLHEGWRFAGTAGGTAIVLDACSGTVMRCRWERAASTAA